MVIQNRPRSPEHKSQILSPKSNCPSWVLRHQVTSVWRKQSQWTRWWEPKSETESCAGASLLALENDWWNSMALFFSDHCVFSSRCVGDYGLAIRMAQGAGGLTMNTASCRWAYGRPLGRTQRWSCSLHWKCVPGSLNIWCPEEEWLLRWPHS